MYKRSDVSTHIGTDHISDAVTELYLRATQFEFRPGYPLSWFPLLTLGKCWIDTLNYSTAFKILVHNTVYLHLLGHYLKTAVESTSLTNIIIGRTTQ